METMPNKRNCPRTTQNCFELIPRGQINNDIEWIEED
jgi:hypothetical protein